MSARVESAPIGGSFAGPILMAILVALGVGALLGAVVTKAVNDRPSGLAPARPLVATGVAAPLWDAQKLEAMQGRAFAEQFRDTLPVTWDALKLDAMAGRVLYQPVAVASEAVATAKPSSTRPPIEGWDASKLEAMKGRVLAAGAGAEDPPVKPHLPKRPPRG